MVFDDTRWAFDRAVGRLNAKNLLDLWTFSCILSCIEYFDSWEHPNNFLHPMLHPEKINIFQRAILSSKAADYKREPLSSNDIPYVFNALTDATGERTHLLEGNSDPSARIRRLLSTMAHQQIRLQESLLLNRIGRTYALLHEIPILHKEELKKRMGPNFVDLDSVSQTRMGLSILEFLSIGYAAIVLMLRRFQSNITIDKELRQYTGLQTPEGVRRRADVMKRITEETRTVRDNFCFEASDLVLPEVSFLTINKIRAFLSLVSRSTRELREVMSQEVVYTEGLIPDRLSPLERYPIVKLDQDKYIIPNLRYFDMAATDLIHYILQEIHPDNEYNQLRGYIQEFYLKYYISNRLSDIQVIPETSYRKGRNRLDGPDLTAIDLKSKTLIAVESKGKRIRVISRVHPGSNYLLEDLATAITAFERLPGKIADLYANLAEYSAYQREIDETKSTQPIAVVVLGEGVYFISELLNDKLQEEPTHFIHNYPYPFCLMRMETFEKAIEVSSQNDIPLGELLKRYWSGSKSSNISDASAEMFAPFSLPKPTLTQEFADKFFSNLFKSIKPDPAP